MLDVGKFKIVAKLGRGNYGSVYKAKDITNGCDVALRKIIVK